MKPLPVAVVLFVLMSCQNVFAKSKDTIVISVDSLCRDFMPRREHIVIPPASAFDEKVEYDDSIRVCGQVVDGFRKNYYLIVYDKKGVKRMEGNFWDHLANGHCIHYDFRGRKISEGDYKLVKKKRYYFPSEKTGTWKYYDISGKIIKQESFLRFNSGSRQINLSPIFNPCPSLLNKEIPYSSSMAALVSKVIRAST